MSLLLAQNMVEYGALAGGASALERFLTAAEHAVRSPQTGVPIGLVVLLVAFVLLRRR